MQPGAVVVVAVVWISVFFVVGAYALYRALRIHALAGAVQAPVVREPAQPVVIHAPPGARYDDRDILKALDTDAHRLDVLEKEVARLKEHSDVHVLLGKAHAHYDLAGRVARDAVAHANEIEHKNVELRGPSAAMTGADKMTNALDFAEIHWPKDASFDRVKMRARITAILGASRG